MTIAPITKVFSVGVSQQRAFDLFLGRMNDWWPKEHSVAKRPRAAIVVEPRKGGRWFERDETGEECQWGDVIEWLPPSRVLLAWRLGADWKYDPDLLTEVEVMFVAAGEKRTEVRFEHRKLEGFGAIARKRREELSGGWPSIIEAYARLVETA
jgi:uncharacterized protein YndB with AHSA1/START domain